MDRLISLDLGKGPSRTAWTLTMLPANPYFTARHSFAAAPDALWLPNSRLAGGTVVGPVQMEGTWFAYVFPAQQMTSREVAVLG